MNTIRQKMQIVLNFVLLLIVCMDYQFVLGKTRDLCQVKPSTSGLCVPTTVGIYFDVETQRCHFMGCSNKRLFDTLENCEKICNNARHIKIRSNSASKTNQTTN